MKSAIQIVETRKSYARSDRGKDGQCLDVVVLTSYPTAPTLGFRGPAISGKRSCGFGVNARQPWMRTAFLLDRRMMHCGGRKLWPDDLRSAEREWLQFCRALNGFSDWPVEACRMVQAAKTYPEAIDKLGELLAPPSSQHRSSARPLASPRPL